LASNSLLEAVVFAHEAALAVAKEVDISKLLKGFDEKISKQEVLASTVKINKLKKSLQNLMYRFYLNKSLNLSLEPFGSEIDKVFSEIKKISKNHRESKTLWELQNMTETARLIINDTLYE
jgi:L-aspartate oxidase